MGGLRRQRRDATANRARILDAAKIALRDHGLSVDMRAIAAAAGVGVGTLYRHFPTREALLHAVTGADLTKLARAQLPGNQTAIDALRGLFHETLMLLVTNRAMIDLLAGSAPSDQYLIRCIDHLRRIGLEAVERARADHTLALDVTPDDIAYQLLGLVRIAQLQPDVAPEKILHHIELSLRGLSM